jgi:hypothetical protein
MLVEFPFYTEGFQSSEHGLGNTSDKVVLEGTLTIGECAKQGCSMGDRFVTGYV